MKLSKETALYEKDAIKNGLAEAGGKAEKYIVTTNDDGIFVHTEGDDSLATGSGWHIGNVLELLKGGICYIRAYLGGTQQNPNPTVIVGNDAIGSMRINNSGLELKKPYTSGGYTYYRTVTLNEDGWFLGNLQQGREWIKLTPNAVQTFGSNHTDIYWKAVEVIDNTRDDSGLQLGRFQLNESKAVVNSLGEDLSCQTNFIQISGNIYVNNATSNGVIHAQIVKNPSSDNPEVVAIVTERAVSDRCTLIFPAIPLQIRASDEFRVQVWTTTSSGSGRVDSSDGRSFLVVRCI